MKEIGEVLGFVLMGVLFLTRFAVHLLNTSEQVVPPEDPAVREPLKWKEMEDLRRMYASMPLDRLAHLYCEYGLKAEARHLIVQELRNRGWQERTLGTGDTVLVESTSQEVQLSSDWIN